VVLWRIGELHAAVAACSCSNQSSTQVGAAKKSCYHATPSVHSPLDGNAAWERCSGRLLCAHASPADTTLACRHRKDKGGPRSSRWPHDCMQVRWTVKPQQGVFRVGCTCCKAAASPMQQPRLSYHVPTLLAPWTLMRVSKLDCPVRPFHHIFVRTTVLRAGHPETENDKVRKLITLESDLVRDTNSPLPVQDRKCKRVEGNQGTRTEQTRTAHLGLGHSDL
jgi:hypothetical protein